jgi:hypothetical protein
MFFDHLLSLKMSASYASTLVLAIEFIATAKLVGLLLIVGNVIVQGVVASGVMMFEPSSTEIRQSVHIGLLGRGTYTQTDDTVIFYHKPIFPYKIISVYQQ